MLRPLFAAFSPVQRKGESRITQRPLILNCLDPIGWQNTRLTEDMSDRNVAFCPLLRHLPVFPKWFREEHGKRKPLAVFERVPELLDGVACDLFCLFDFHFSCPPVLGSPRSLTRSRGSENAKQGTEAERLAVQVGTGRTRECHCFSWWREAC